MSVDVEKLRGVLDFRKFAEAFWRVYPKSGIDGKPKDAVPFKLKPAQRLIDDAKNRQKSAGLPVRIAVLKGRQLTVSTYCCGLMQHYVMTNKGVTALSIADKMDLPKQWIRRADSWLDMTPTFTADGVGYRLKPHVKATNAIELWFDLMQSRYTIASAEGKTPGVGSTLDACHFSEAALWPNPDDIERQTFQGIPAKPGTIVIVESTGEVVGDWWYNFWWAAKRGESNYEAIFLPWFLEDEYSMDASAFGEMNEAEERIFKMGASREQLAWRRWKITNDFGGDSVWFANQFPSTPEEAFLSGGRNVFTSEEVALAKATIREPVWRGDLIPGARPQSYGLFESAGGGLLTFDHDPKHGRPDTSMHYVIGADCQWSKRAESDYDAAFVECVETGKTCALLWGRWDMALYFKLLSCLSYYYSSPNGPALLAPERNSQASDGIILPLLVVIGEGWRHPNLYVRTKDAPYGALMPVDYGWLTDEHTKPELVLSAKMRLASSGSMDWADSGTVDEMASYIRTKDNRLSAPDGQHDDRLVARMITSRVAIELRAILAASGELAGTMGPEQMKVLEHMEKINRREREAKLTGAW